MASISRLLPFTRYSIRFYRLSITFTTVEWLLVPSLSTCVIRQIIVRYDPTDFRSFFDTTLNDRKILRL